MKVDDARILYVYANNPLEKFYCSNWLCAFPAYALDRAGYAVGMIPIDEFVAGGQDADLYIVERILWNGTDSVRFDQMADGPTRRRLDGIANRKVLDRIATVQAQGHKVAAVFDDHYEAFPRDTEASDAAALWLDGEQDGVYVGFLPIDQFRDGLHMVDAVFSPSQFLLSHYAGDRDNVYLVRNRPLLDMWQAVEWSPNVDDKVRIGWSGTAQHLDGWRDNPVLDALERLKDEVVVVGATSAKEIGKLIGGRGVEYRNAGTVPFEDYPSVVYGYDIGICPLGGEYDKGRSWIKWLECSLAGKPVVAQDHHGVYDECCGGYLVESEYDWYDALLYLIEDQETYRRLSREGRSWAWQQGWDENLSELTGIFEAVLCD